MADWSSEFQEDVVKRLRDKGVNRPCPRCNKAEFALVDGFAVFGLVERLDADSATDLVPSVCVACRNCGYLTFHALAPLGLLPKDQPPPPGDQQVVIE
jgi:hypothetical protein